jgi:hypothetical protein
MTPRRQSVFQSAVSITHDRDKVAAAVVVVADEGIKAGDRSARPQSDATSQ